jgi:cytochrome c556
MAMGAFAASTATPPNLHALMKNVVAVQAQVIWDTGNKALGDDGNPDASKLTAADWNRLVEAAEKVRQGAQALAGAEHVMAAAPGQKLQDEGNPGASDAKTVQRLIDANPKAFSAFATTMATNMDGLVAAVRARDLTKVNDLSGALDEICEQCHKQFWYPNQ